MGPLYPMFWRFHGSCPGFLWVGSGVGSSVVGLVAWALVVGLVAWALVLGLVAWALVLGLVARALVLGLVAREPFLWASRATGTQRNFARGRFLLPFWFWSWPLHDNFLGTRRALLFVVTHSLISSGRV